MHLYVFQIYIFILNIYYTLINSRIFSIHLHALNINYFYICLHILNYILQYNILEKFISFIYLYEKVTEKYKNP